MQEQLERYRWLVVALFVVPLLSGLLYLAADRLDGPPALQVQTDPQTDSEVRVYVAGAVRNPGVYTLSDGARWLDAVEAAGGLAPDADTLAVNLARRARDEDQITVPALAAGAVAGASRGPLVNINTASEAELMDLPGIGEVRAGRIVRSRAAEGPFVTMEELVSRAIVPQSVLDDIASLITLSQ